MLSVLVVSGLTWLTGPSPAPARPARGSREARRLVERGRRLVGAHQYAEGVALLREAVALDPGHPQAWVQLGFAYNALRQYPAAVSALESGMRVAPDNGFAWGYLAVALNGLRRSEEARDAATRALELRPRDLWVWDALAVSYLDQG